MDGLSDIDTGTGRPWMRNVAGGTIMGWVTTRLLSGTQSLWGAFGGTGTTRAKLSVNATGNIGLRANALDADATSAFNSAGAITVNGRFHVCGVFVFSGKFGIVYINGVADTSGTFANMTAGNTSNTNCGLSKMASNETGSTNSWNGELEDVRVYNRALSADEIATIYAAKGKDSILEGLQARWPLNEGPPGVSAANIVDLSSNVFGGVVEGSAIFQSSGVTVQTGGPKSRRPVLGRFW